MPSPYRRKVLLISIHALREEGDQSQLSGPFHVNVFLSTPSARRATGSHVPAHRGHRISIHALREEGDFCFLAPGCPLRRISIHALREEGDSKNRDKISIFL